MKEELIRYKCDNCKNTITVIAGNYAGTPLDNKWIRMYVKIKPSDVQKTKLHFCKEKCAENFLVNRRYNINKS